MRRLLDSSLGRVSGYRLMTLGLGAIAITAFVLSATGLLFYTPVQLGVSLVVAVGSVVASGWLAGRIVRSPAHLESSVITGLLLFFLFWPSEDPAALGVLAVTGVLATASKYLLAVRGRHVFNPAAIAAVIIGFTQLGSSVWWVANSYLLPVVAIAGFLVLWRTRRFAVAGVFVAISGVLCTGRLIIAGTDAGTAAWTVLASFPIVFLAAFMLSEPLTLPPRRRQQLLVAAVVGVLFSIPLAVGPFSMTPELALVVGNAVAFVFGQRRAVRLRLVEARHPTPDIVEYVFAPLRPVVFRAGQSLELAVPHRRADSRGTRRVFSISSPPDDADRITIAMRMPEVPSTYKRALAALVPGSVVRATSVGGDFVLPQDPSEPVLLIAGGIGITPFASQLASDSAAGRTRDVVLVYAAGATGIAYREVVAASGAEVVVVGEAASAEVPTGWEARRGRVDHELLDAAVPDWRTRRTFVSGSPAMVDGVRAALARRGGRSVTTDSFSGY
ncbi:ferredoxin--NADP reductase [Leifsonia sp. Leaf264]|uniref:ferredoxin--NADP reductase n=1 Tax=Leifsonia sp. Leaf264 TaxID=1736314 RepID=UPI0006FA4723|nr:hypothetical protein [Leifsonia sp. Leaf264]KQO99495.1 hypothetical protein ASF30_06060 [Leifsonia sp. Leaf264]